MDFFSELNHQHIKFIEAQKLYFVATAGVQGRVNLSPKGLDSLRVKRELNADTGAEQATTLHWLNLTGSGNETAAHVLENQRMTLMFCSFDKQPLILRIYGLARMISPDEPNWDSLYAEFSSQPGARQIFELAIDSVQTSCGYGVPYYEFLGERPTLTKWTEKKGEEGIRAYQRETNLTSIDGKPTGLPD